MDRKIINLVICVLVCFVIILGLFIFQLTNVQKESATTPEAETVLEETVIDDPSGEDGFKVHKSENGYTIKYPEEYEAKRMAKAIDFILEDDKSGSSLNIVTARNDGTLKQMSREEFEYSLMQGSMDVEILDYTQTELNGTPAIVARYTYNGSSVTQTIIVTEYFGYNITVTESGNITEEMSAVFKNVVKSFSLD